MARGNFFLTLGTFVAFVTAILSVLFIYLYGDSLDRYSLGIGIDVLRGKDGLPGRDGIDGRDGKDGKDGNCTAVVGPPGAPCNITELTQNITDAVNATLAGLVDAAVQPCTCSDDVESKLNEFFGDLTNISLKVPPCIEGDDDDYSCNFTGTTMTTSYLSATDIDFSGLLEGGSIIATTFTTNIATFTGIATFQQLVQFLNDIAIDGSVTIDGALDVGQDITTTADLNGDNLNLQHNADIDGVLFVAGLIDVYDNFTNTTSQVESTSEIGGTLVLNNVVIAGNCTNCYPTCPAFVSCDLEANSLSVASFVSVASAGSLIVGSLVNKGANIGLHASGIEISTVILDLYTNVLNYRSERLNLPLAQFHDGAVLEAPTNQGAKWTHRTILGSVQFGYNAFENNAKRGIHSTHHQDFNGTGHFHWHGRNTTGECYNNGTGTGTPCFNVFDCLSPTPGLCMSNNCTSGPRVGGFCQEDYDCEFQLDVTCMYPEVNTTLTVAETVEITGNVTIHGYLVVDGTITELDSISDARLKTNITDLQPRMDMVRKLRPVSYQLLQEPSVRKGFIAQEILELDATLVGTFEQDGKQYYKFNKENLVADLVLAVQELDRVVQAQQRLIEELLAR